MVGVVGEGSGGLRVGHAAGGGIQRRWENTAPVGRGGAERRVNAVSVLMSSNSASGTRSVAQASGFCTKQDGNSAGGGTEQAPGCSGLTPGSRLHSLSLSRSLLSSIITHTVPSSSH